MINTSASGLEAEAQRVGANTTGLSGSFKINGEDIKITNKVKESYSKLRANYISEQYEQLISNKKQVTVERDGKRVTTTYDKLTDDQKALVENYDVLVKAMKTIDDLKKQAKDDPNGPTNPGQPNNPGQSSSQGNGSTRSSS